ncbi:MAG: M23 family metallopeptidase [Lachnospiraceae bacterium]|nr:M23 family metallopeptidase [Candidatus Merdinaster equi]
MEQNKPSYGMDIEINSGNPDGIHKRISMTPRLWKSVKITGISLASIILLWGITMTILFCVASGNHSAASEENSNLIAENESLKNDIADLNRQNSVLSATVTHKTQEDESRVQEEIKSYVPDGIPVNGASEYKEKESEEKGKYLEFTADLGTEVVACGSGVVTLSEADPEWGYRITIDHQNGYTSSYHVRENPKFIVGSDVKKGEVLFAVTRNNRTLEYTVFYEGSSIDPISIMEVYG